MPLAYLSVTEHALSYGASGVSHAMKGTSIGKFYSPFVWVCIRSGPLARVGLVGEDYATAQELLPLINGYSSVSSVSYGTAGRLPEY